MSLEKKLKGAQNQLPKTDLEIEIPEGRIEIHNRRTGASIYFYCKNEEFVQEQISIDSDKDQLLGANISYFTKTEDKRKNNYPATILKYANLIRESLKGVKGSIHKHLENFEQAYDLYQRRIELHKSLQEHNRIAKDKNQIVSCLPEDY